MKMIRRFIMFSFAFLCLTQIKAQVTNYALKLDGTDKVSCGQISELNNREAYVVQFLIAPQEWNSNAYVFKRGTGNSEFSARLSSTQGEIIFKVGTQELSAAGISVNGWTQLSFVAFQNGADIWINGSKTWNSNSNLSIPESAESFIIGENFKGRIDEFRIWDTEMPSAESDNLMFQNTVNKFHPQWDHLVLYYKFDQEQCLDNIVDSKFVHHGTMNSTIQRVAVVDNNYFRYRVVTGYSDFNRHCDRTQIDQDMHLMTNDLIMLNASLNGYTGEITMTAPDNGVLAGGASFLSNYEGRNGVLSLDGTGAMNIGKNIIREGTPAATASTFEGWFNISNWTEGASLLKKEESADKCIKIYLGNYADKELIVETSGWKTVFKALDDVNKWQHLAVVFDPNAGRGKVKLYVNNVSKTGSTTKPDNQTKYELMGIDAEALIGEGFNGKMDEIMIWRNARTSFAGDMDGTSAELKFPGGGYSAIFLDAHWKFDKQEDLGLNLRGWQGMLQQIKDIYSGYRGFKIRLGIISSDAYANGDKVWPDNIGKAEWRNKLADGISKLITYCDGIDVDLEWLDNNPNNPKWASYGEMVKALRKVIPSDKILSVSLHPVSYTLPTTADVLGAIDYITYQNYGPRPSSLVWSAYSGFYDTALKYGIPAEKIHLSMATTIVMSDGSGKNVKGYKDLDLSTITKESNTADYAGVSYTFNGVDEVKKKMNLLVEKNAGGSMYFDMGNDVSVQNDLSLIRALNSVMSSNVDMLITDVNNIPGTGIDNEMISKKNEIKIYPNPAKDFVIIEGAFNGESVKYELFTISGVKVWNKNSLDEKITINLNEFPKGIYILHINNGIEAVTKKIQVR